MCIHVALMTGMPEAVRERYRRRACTVQHMYWSQQLPVNQLKTEDTLCVYLREPGTVHWGVDGWHAIADAVSRDTGLAVHRAKLPS